MAGGVLVGRNVIYKLAALFDPPKNGSAGFLALVYVERDGLLRQILHEFPPRPFVFQR